MRRIKSVILCFMCMVLFMGIGTTVSASSTVIQVEKSANGLHEIMGTSSVTIGQMVNYYQANAKYPGFYANTEAPTIYAFAQIYMEECKTEGVKAEVAFSQCMLETGYLTFKGDVLPSQYNFAGLETWGKQEDGTVVRGNSYTSVRQGIRAHVQRLKAYAVKGTTASSFKNPCVDKDKYSSWWVQNVGGSAPYVEYLERDNNPSGYGWATDPSYADKLLVQLNRCLGASRYTTWYRGVDYSAIYDPDYYLTKYPDIARAYAGREEDAIQHFLNYGMKEGRQGCASFAVQSYRSQYVDLRTVYGYDLKPYYLHYMNYGKHEGRKGTGCTTLQGGVTKLNGVDYSEVYDYNYYVSKYADIKRIYGYDDAKVLQHFVNYGMREGRQGSARFDVKSYYNRYADLRRAFGSNWQLYYTHYIKSGKREGRVAVNCTSIQNATTVYNNVNYGAVYDYYYYLAKYPDVARAFGGDETKTLQHFINCGMREGRQGSANFRVQTYANRYSDLKRAYGSNWKSYYIHYLNYGNKEGRSGK